MGIFSFFRKKHSKVATNPNDIQEEIVGKDSNNLRGEQPIMDKSKSENIMKDVPNSNSLSVQRNLSAISNDVAPLLWISYSSDVPDYIGFGFKATIYIDENGNVNTKTESWKDQDPSTIWINAPIEEGEEQGLDYWPHYLGLSPMQRYTYLTWLHDITQPTDMGFVFLLFYGLEKHLIAGDIDKALDVILRLRKHHSNKSFQKYSESSIIYACIMRKRLDLLAKISSEMKTNAFDNIHFYIARTLGLDLGAENLINIFYKLYPKCRKAIKEKRDAFLDEINEAISIQYGGDGLPISDIDMSDTRTRTVERFCNYSFPDELRVCELTDYYSNKEILKRIDVIFTISYENLKANRTKQPRRPTAYNQLSHREKKIMKYDQMLKSKLITKAEYDVLVNNIKE